MRKFDDKRTTYLVKLIDETYDRGFLYGVSPGIERWPNKATAKWRPYWDVYVYYSHYGCEWCFIPLADLELIGVLT